MVSSLKPKLQKLYFSHKCRPAPGQKFPHAQTIKYNLKTSDQEQNFSNAFLLWAVLAKKQKKQFHGLLLPAPWKESNREKGNHSGMNRQYGIPLHEMPVT